MRVHELERNCLDKKRKKETFSFVLHIEQMFVCGVFIIAIEFQHRLGWTWSIVCDSRSCMAIELPKCSFNFSYLSQIRSNIKQFSRISLWDSWMLYIWIKGQSHLVWTKFWWNSNLTDEMKPEIIFIPNNKKLSAFETNHSFKLEKCVTNSHWTFESMETTNISLTQIEIYSSHHPTYLRIKQIKRQFILRPWIKQFFFRQ